jgi:hypothetical protein
MKISDMYCFTAGTICWTRSVITLITRRKVEGLLKKAERL